MIPPQATEFDAGDGLRVAPSSPPTEASAPARPAAGPGTPPASFGVRVRRGIAWQLLGRGGEQGIRLIANLALARLLAPEEFGLLGMAATGLAMAEALAFVGTDQAVLAEPRGRRPRFVATAWFISLARGLLLALVLLVLAGPMARGFQQPDATGLFMLIALQPILLSLAHPGAFVALRNLEFRRWTTARLLAIVLGTGLTVGFAVALRDARALIIGQLATTALSSAATHLITPRRVRVAPRPHRRHLKRLLRFSAGAAGTPLLIMVVMQAPVLLIGPVLGPAALGVYLMLRRLCDVGRQLAVQAVGAVLIPASAKVADDPRRFRAAWSRTLRPTALIALGGSGLLAWLGGDVPALLLGPNFRGPDGLFSALAVAGGLSAVLGVTGPFFWGLARPALDRSVQLVRVMVLLTLGVALIGPMGPTGLAVATVASAAAGVIVSATLIARHAAIPWRETASAIAPGLLLGASLWGGGALLDASLQPGPVARVVIAGAVLVSVGSVRLGPLLARHLASPIASAPRRASGASA